MTPSVRSRLAGSWVGFGFGFALANYGLFVPRPDQFIWLFCAAVVMLTAGAGVMFADSSSRFSVWGTLGLELLAVFVLVPFAWVASLALQPEDGYTRSIWPRNATTVNAEAILDSATFRHAALNSLIVAGASTFIAVFLGVFGAYALIHSRFRGRRSVYALILGALFIPLVVLVGPMADQALTFGLYDTRWSTTVCYLALTVPLALWLLVSLFGGIPWSLRDAARTDGAAGWQVLRRVYVPLVAPGVIVVTLIVFFVACNDLVLGLALGATDSSLPVPASLASYAGDFDNPIGVTAAAGLIWFLPVLLFVLVFQRKIVWLLGRPNR